MLRIAHRVLVPRAASSASTWAHRWRYRQQPPWCAVQRARDRGAPTMPWRHRRARWATTAATVRPDEHDAPPPPPAATATAEEPPPSLPWSDLAATFAALAREPGRNARTVLLARVLHRVMTGRVGAGDGAAALAPAAAARELRRVLLLALGRVAPRHEGTETHTGDASIARAVALCVAPRPAAVDADDDGADGDDVDGDAKSRKAADKAAEEAHLAHVARCEADVKAHAASCGDLGEAVVRAFAAAPAPAPAPAAAGAPLTVADVLRALEALAGEAGSGKGSAARKQAIAAALFARAAPDPAACPGAGAGADGDAAAADDDDGGAATAPLVYLVRLLQGSGKMRVGVQERTALAALVLALSDGARQDFAEHFHTLELRGAQTRTGPSAPQLGSQRLCIRE